MSEKLYSDNKIRSIHQEYLDAGQSVTKFSAQRRLSSNALRRGFNRLSLHIIPQSLTKRKFPVADDFFSRIDTEEKAYVLGFIFADGCNHEECHRLEVSLAKKDESILIELSKLLLCGNVNIKEYKRRKSEQNRVGLYVVSQKISDDLKLLGCGARKTFSLKFPELPQYLQHHFMRGYFDGDGMLVIYERLKPRCITKARFAEFSIVSTKEMLKSIGCLINALGVNFKITKRHKRRKTNNFTLRVHGNQQIKKVCDFMYYNAHICLNRKQAAYLQLVELANKNQARFRRAA